MPKDSAFPSSKTGTEATPFEVQKVAGDEALVLKVFGQQDDAGAGTGTKQLPKDHFEKMVTAGQVITPLYDPMIWAFLLEQNTRLNTLVTKMAQNTVGLGWELVPIKEEETWVEQHREEIEAEKEKIAPLLQQPNPEMPFTQLMTQVKIDEESTGQGYIEVTRTKSGNQVGALYHVPSYTIRMCKEGDRYVQMRPSDTSKKVYFKPFGVERELSASTGKWENDGSNGKEVYRVTPEDRATEIIQFRIYTPRSSFYGVPRVVSAAPAIAGTRLAHRRNVAFFENDATPRIAILVNGGELSDESMKMIEEFIDARGKGPGNAGRVMLLQARGADQILGSGKDLNIQLMPLTVGVQDDASFIKYLNANNEEVREAFGIGQIFIGTSDDVNRAVALAMKQVTVEQVFEPEASRYEYRMNATILKSFEPKYVKLRFKRPRTTDTLMEAQAYSMLSAVGGITPNDVRDFLNKPRFDAKWANTPVAVLKQGFLHLRDKEDATIWSEYGDTYPPMNLVNAQAEATGAKAAEAAQPAQPSGEQRAAKILEDEGMSGLVEEMQSLAQGLTKLGFSVSINMPDGTPVTE